MYTTFGLDLNCERSMNIGHPLAALARPRISQSFRQAPWQVLISLHLCHISICLGDSLACPDPFLCVQYITLSFVLSQVAEYNQGNILNVRPYPLLCISYFFSLPFSASSLIFWCELLYFQWENHGGRARMGMDLLTVAATHHYARAFFVNRSLEVFNG